jgi:hypothetical protein
MAQVITAAQAIPVDLLAMERDAFVRPYNNAVERRWGQLREGGLRMPRAAYNAQLGKGEVIPRPAWSRLNKISFTVGRPAGSLDTTTEPFDAICPLGVYINPTLSGGSGEATSGRILAVLFRWSAERGARKQEEEAAAAAAVAEAAKTAEAAAAAEGTEAAAAAEAAEGAAAAAAEAAVSTPSKVLAAPMGAADLLRSCTDELQVLLADWGQMLEAGALVEPSKLLHPEVKNDYRVHQRDDTLVLTPGYLADAATRAVSVEGTDLEQEWTAHAWFGEGRLRQPTACLPYRRLPAALADCGVATAVLAWSETVDMADVKDVQAALRALWLPVDLKACKELSAAFDAAIDVDARAARGKTGKPTAKRVAVAEVAEAEGAHKQARQRY